jgi:hypothetical protein
MLEVADNQFTISKVGEFVATGVNPDDPVVDGLFR